VVFDNVNSDPFTGSQGGEGLAAIARDTPGAIRVRLEAYEENTRPLTEYYREKGLLIPVSAEGHPDEVFERTLKALGESIPSATV